MRRVLLSAFAGIALALYSLPAAAQEPVAEVRTWSGDVVRLDQPTLEVFYTVLVREEDAQESSDAASPAAPGNQPFLFGSAQALAGALEKRPEPLSGQRPAETVTLHRGGTEVRIPLANISSLVFARQPVASTLPPHVAPTHFHYAVTAILNDGTQIEGDYINLGTTIVRGTTPYGRVDIPWHEIELLRFVR